MAQPGPLPARYWDTYPYEPLPNASVCIRLIRIIPRHTGEPEDSPIKCRLKTVALAHEALLKGESITPPVRPTIRFDEYVTFKHDEIFKVVDDKLVAEKRGVMKRTMDRLMGRSKNERRNRAINKMQEMPGSQMILNHMPNLMGREEIGDSISLTLGTEDQHGRMTSNFRELDPEQARDTIGIPHGEPQYRDRFRWQKIDRDDKRPGNYVAMSYTWGDSDDRVQIWIDDNSVQVTRNLEQGLRQFRELEPFKEGTWMWVDAVCIDQTNIRERDEQVKMMSAIYQQAGNIVVWLGPADETSAEAIDYLHVTSINYRTEHVEAMDHADLHYAHAHRNQAQMTLTSFMNLWSKTLRDMAPHLDNPETEQEMVQLYLFFNRPYWRRLWIIQELAMGRPGMPMICGPVITQWRFIRDAVFMITSALDIFHEMIPRVLRKRGIPMEVEPSILHVATIAQLECAGHREPLPPLPEGHYPLTVNFHSGKNIHGPLRGDAVHMALRLIRESHSTKAIDRVYGMLAIPSLPPYQIEVSYEKGTGEAYVEFVKQCIILGYSPAIFQFLDGTGAPISADYTLPFWCPDLNKKPDRRIGIIEGKWHADDPTGQAQPFMFGRQEIFPEFVVENGKEHLMHRGFITDAIDGLGAISMSDRGGLKFQPLFQGEVVQPKFSPEWPYEDDPEDMVWWHLVGGARVGGDRAPSSFSCLLSAIPTEEPPKDSPDYRLWDFINTSKDLLIAGRPLKSYFTPKVATEEADFATASARQAMAARTSYRRLATTPKGRLALVPASTQPGDAIIVLIGHGNPVVASVVIMEDGSNVFKIKGDAFVHGVMEGEAMRKEVMQTGRDFFEEFYFI